MGVGEDEEAEGGFGFVAVVVAVGGAEVVEEGVEEWGGGGLRGGVGWEWEYAGASVEDWVEVEVCEGGDGYREEDREEELAEEKAEGHLGGLRRVVVF